MKDFAVCLQLWGPDKGVVMHRLKREHPTCTERTDRSQKNAVVPVNSGKQKVALAAIESSKNWFEDFGSAQLSGGLAVIRLDSTFTQTVNTRVGYHRIKRGLIKINPNTLEMRESCRSGCNARNGTQRTQKPNA
jgi:hypothetical protein